MISTNTMTYEGYSAQVMESERLRGEEIHSLPPGKALNVYPVDSFLSPPENWLKKGAFVVPVKPNKGLWFNFRMNDENNTAVLMTVKGCNPVTGLETSGFHLDRYENKCPKHGCDFESERFCPECGYKWPDRSYLSGSPLWWDGWVCEGAIRQFFFTEEMMRDIATHLIGKENTVPAFGFAFYSPKERRTNVTPRIIHNLYNESYTVYHMPKNIMYSQTSQTAPTDMTHGMDVLYEKDPGHKVNPIRGSSLGALRSSKRKDTSLSSTPPKSINNVLYSAQVQQPDSFMCLDSVAESAAVGGSADMTLAPDLLVRDRCFTPQKEVAVGAGARIRQKLPVDNYPLDSWNDKPDSVMTIYFVFEEEFKKMAEGGFKDYVDCREGMLKGLPVG